MKKIGGMGKVLGMIPGISKIKKQIDEVRPTKLSIPIRTHNKGPHMTLRLLS
jgi:signal recognition particle GTPase